MMQRKKIRRMRGSRRHGYGKHHRGKGNRGGVGRAGHGKRAAHKKPSFRLERMGRHGFVNQNVKIVHKTISFREIEDKLDRWIAEKVAHEKDGVVSVDLGKMGFTKLLSTGKISRKMHLSIPFASEKAVEKIKAAGGQQAA